MGLSNLKWRALAFLFSLPLVSLVVMMMMRQSIVSMGYSNMCMIGYSSQLFLALPLGS